MNQESKNDNDKLPNIDINCNDDVNVTTKSNKVLTKNSTEGAKRPLHINNNDDIDIPQIRAMKAQRRPDQDSAIVRVGDENEQYQQTSIGHHVDNQIGYNDVHLQISSFHSINESAQQHNNMVSIGSMHAKKSAAGRPKKKIHHRSAAIRVKRAQDGLNDEIQNIKNLFNQHGTPKTDSIVFVDDNDFDHFLSSNIIFTNGSLDDDTKNALKAAYEQCIKFRNELNVKPKRTKPQQRQNKEENANKFISQNDQQLLLETGSNSSSNHDDTNLVPMVLGNISNTFTMSHSKTSAVSSDNNNNNLQTTHQENNNLLLISTTTPRMPHNCLSDQQQQTVQFLQQPPQSNINKTITSNSYILQNSGGNNNHNHNNNNNNIQYDLLASSQSPQPALLDTIRQSFVDCSHQLGIDHIPSFEEADIAEMILYQQFLLHQLHVQLRKVENNLKMVLDRQPKKLITTPNIINNDNKQQTQTSQQQKMKLALSLPNNNITTINNNQNDNSSSTNTSCTNNKKIIHHPQEPK